MAAARLGDGVEGIRGRRGTCHADTYIFPYGNLSSGNDGGGKCRQSRIRLPRRCHRPVIGISVAVSTQTPLTRTTTLPTGMPSCVSSILNPTSFPEMTMGVSVMRLKPGRWFARVCCAEDETRRRLRRRAEQPPHRQLPVTCQRDRHTHLRDRFGLLTCCRVGLVKPADRHADGARSGHLTPGAEIRELPRSVCRPEIDDQIVSAAGIEVAQVMP